MKKEDLYYLLVGREVELKDPAPNSSYNFAFTGYVESTNPVFETVRVRDGDDNCFDVTIDEILSIL